MWDGFECAVRCLINEGSAERERELVSRLVAACGKPLPATLASGSRLTHLFPEPDVLAARDLSGYGFSKARAQALDALARAVRDGRVDFSAPADEVMRALLQLPGSSERMAEEVALRGLGEPDAFPVECRMPWPEADGPSPSDVAESWRPWRGYAALYLRRAEDARTAEARAARRFAAAS